MIADHETNRVYLSDLLPRRHPRLTEGLKRHLKAAKVKVGFIHGTRDIWARDYMPMQVAVDRFVQFRYEPDYLRGRFKHLITPPEVCRRIVPKGQCIQSDLNVDGGNIVRWHDTVIMTEKVFEENPTLSRKEVARRLTDLLGVHRMVFIPQEPGEWLGHADGILRFIDGRTVVVNDYTKVNSEYGKTLLQQLKKGGLDFIEIPYGPSIPSRRGIPSARGVYVNLLQVKQAVLVPVYNRPEDETVCRTLGKAFPSSRIIPVECGALADEGGCLNCVTWGIKTLPAS